ncbi:DISARM system phospholipase D-like protein DrmC [Bradyrhizobium sp. CCBAU 21360]|uniref:DISARM system phospholipase D-like protein DrmC n=1 Tax=Bradyrhizobium sp. CCBAU 21360 TaxID=1325081 RepID=UPI0023064632|nr:DISARM system phospholipase D-like protein DrmC [Bradyrhizobium sp. CCBAU 21360]
MKVVADTPPARLEQLIAAVGAAVSAQDTIALDRWPLSAHAKNITAELVARWRATSVTPAELAGILVGAARAYHDAKAEQELELVWTGPAGPSIATRRTDQALLEVIDAATGRLFVTSFVAYKVPSIVRAFEEAVRRGVRLSMLLEPAESVGGNISIDVIGKMKAALPGARILTWINKEPKFVGGSVHAKIAVADETICFVSSANLTGHAMERNMEAGILIKGGNIPIDLQRHLEALEAANVIALT